MWCVTQVISWTHTHAVFKYCYFHTNCEQYFLNMTHCVPYLSHCSGLPWPPASSSLCSISGIWPSGCGPPASCCCAFIASLYRAVNACLLCTPVENVRGHNECGVRLYVCVYVTAHFMCEWLLTVTWVHGSAASFHWLSCEQPVGPSPVWSPSALELLSPADCTGPKQDLGPQPIPCLLKVKHPWKSMQALSQGSYCM